jgi:hypothetical protein
MTEHILAEHEQEDSHTMRSLGRFIALFATFSILLAVGVSIFAP